MIRKVVEDLLVVNSAECWYVDAWLCIARSTEDHLGVRFRATSSKEKASLLHPFQETHGKCSLMMLNVYN